MEQQIIIAGFGGQGVQLIGHLLIDAGMREGLEVSFLPSYGPEMRGGTTSCDVIISSDPVASPIVGDATCAIVLNRPSLDKFEPRVEKVGALIVNSSLIDRKAERDDITAYYVPANDIAQELGNSRVANMIMLGAYLAVTHVVTPESVMEALKETFGERRARLLPINETALRRGMACVEGE